MFLHTHLVWLSVTHIHMHMPDFVYKWQNVFLVYLDSDLQQKFTTSMLSFINTKGLSSYRNKTLHTCKEWFYSNAIIKLASKRPKPRKLIQFRFVLLVYHVQICGFEGICKTWWFCRHEISGCTCKQTLDHKATHTMTFSIVLQVCASLPISATLASLLHHAYI